METEWNQFKIDKLQRWKKGKRPYLWKKQHSVKVRQEEKHRRLCLGVNRARGRRGTADHEWESEREQKERAICEQGARLRWGMPRWGIQCMRPSLYRVTCMRERQAEPDEQLVYSSPLVIADWPWPGLSGSLSWQLKTSKETEGSWRRVTLQPVKDDPH